MKGGGRMEEKSRVEGEEILQNLSTYLAQEKKGKRKRVILGKRKNEKGKRPTGDELLN